MKSVIGCAVIALALAASAPAEAKGCLKGALVGGVAGHYAGHHGTLGAVAGCVVGRHRANKQVRMQQQQPWLGGRLDTCGKLASPAPWRNHDPGPGSVGVHGRGIDAAAVSNHLQRGL